MVVMPSSAPAICRSTIRSSTCGVGVGGRENAWAPGHGAREVVGLAMTWAGDGAWLDEALGSATCFAPARARDPTPGPDSYGVPDLHLHERYDPDA